MSEARSKSVKRSWFKSFRLTLLAAIILTTSVTVWLMSFVLFVRTEDLEDYMKEIQGREEA